MSFSGGKLTVTGPTATAGIFCTYPADYLSVWGGVMDQVRPPHCNVSVLQLVQKPVLSILPVCKSSV